MNFNPDYTMQITKIVTPIIYILIGILVYELIRVFIKRAVKKSNLKKNHHKKRMNTISSLLINISKYVIIIIVFILILTNFGINVSSIVAGLGITAALIGLAFQDLAKDLIAGVSIIIEDQYEIGDTVEINGFKGEVVALGLRSTRIKNFTGQTLIIANHTITEVINYNLYNNLAVIDVSVDYDEDLDKVEKVLNDLSKKLKGKIPKSIGEMKILGINSLDSSAIIYRITLETVPNEFSSIQRVLRKEIKQAFDKENIKIPFDQIEVHHGK